MPAADAPGANARARKRLHLPENPPAERAAVRLVRAPLVRRHCHDKEQQKEMHERVTFYTIEQCLLPHPPFVFRDSKKLI